MKVSIVGCGHGGSAMVQLLSAAKRYDEPLGIGTREEVQDSDIVFLCPPPAPRRKLRHLYF